MSNIDNQGTGANRPDTSHLSDLGANINAAISSLNLRFKFVDLVIEFFEMDQQALNKCAKRVQQPTSTLAHYDAALVGASIPLVGGISAAIPMA